MLEFRASCSISLPFETRIAAMLLHPLLLGGGYKVSCIHQVGHVTDDVMPVQMALSSTRAIRRTPTTSVTTTITITHIIRVRLTLRQL